MNKAVFVDRDGVLNEPVVIGGKPHPPRNIEDVIICRGIKEELEKLSSMGYLIIIVSNQPDVRRNVATIQEVESINLFLTKHLPVNDTYVCYHDNYDGCLCRKPKPGMLLEAARDHNLDLSLSWMIGDRKSDVDAGKLAGCRTIFIDRNYSEERPTNYDYIMTDIQGIAEAITWL